jgi:hypothetical protein
MENDLKKLSIDFRKFVAKSSLESNKFGKEYVATPKEVLNWIYQDSFPYDDLTRETFLDALYYSSNISGSINLNLAYSEIVKLLEENEY